MEKGTKILTEVSFEYCPNCGEKVEPKNSENVCQLCGTQKSTIHRDR